VASVETQATSTLRNSDRRTSALIGGSATTLIPGSGESADDPMLAGRWVRALR